MACLAYPEEAMFAIPAAEKEFPVCYLEMTNENRGGDIKWTVTEDGDKVYLNFQADDPNKPPVMGPHNYDIEKMPLETVPVIPEGKHVYLTGNGQFPLKATIAYSFCGRCKSIHMKPQGDELFTCIWTDCPELAVGDQTR